MLHLSLLSSSSSSSNGLSFVTNDLYDEIIYPIVQDLIASEDDQQNLVFFLQLQQAAQELTPSASSPKGKRRCINRDREQTHERLYRDYFADEPIYNEQHFRRRFRMRKHLFLQIVDALSNHSE